MVASTGERGVRRLPAHMLVGAPAALMLAGFFAFVGYHKALSPVTSLVEHRVWTLVLPESLGRLLGWSEMILAAALLALLSRSRRAIARLAALLLILNQSFAAWVHSARGETDALPQNATLIMLLAVVAWAASHQLKSKGVNT